jgi:PAB-dependent poly(A)-specific ribonuclease subunit 3
LLKLGFVNERPELGIDRQWAETGDRYVLKLFSTFHLIHPPEPPTLRC